ncbi:MAG TPA: Asp-tRNA(Asn)/Glu-tRNA(Gln) amidotransferase subunit GatC [Tepidisphaeraceae bacterium]|nr:Asp-tRNA(Asn)/Glu-tRNA(Gln) amidotransferase subunit GatC [Tepidisphaeraceae bacterium]
MPAPRITLDQVKHVAKLSRLALSDEQLQKFTTQLEPILQYIDKISQADITGVEPMAHALPLSNVLRDDSVGPALPLEKVLQNAPDTDGPFFKVPKILSNDEDSAG